MGATPSRSGRFPINGLNVYYEVYGNLDAAQPALLLIPGAFMSAGSMPEWVTRFAERRPVITFDQQGHDRTPDTSRAMSYEQFADDAAELLRALGVERVDVMGYSQGGGVALQLAIRHDDVVGKLVLMSATFHRDGWHPSLPESMAHLDAAAFAGTEVERAFRAHTPDDAAFGAYLEKMKTLNAEDQEIPEAQVRGIRAKTMVIVGDADSVNLDHAVTLFRLRGGIDDEAATTGLLQKTPAARLVVLPAMSHIGLAGEAAILVPMVTAFLDDVAPTTPDLF
ncbi:alpha/beta hydrolase [Mycobacterium sp. 236(2023)]|uniref:alpha/beta fold hydrolase n=1 Tax=Mycobacterium sp. 236(2023) TaxID=3038163 RepID=UPI0024152315|nr:alpha/beta hydrolase [Mycobacterium sp. 236(2023)]MDG4666695.1 alpha/beta hydrolase [Mycobacterium sp. 236(2023)]